MTSPTPRHWASIDPATHAFCDKLALEGTINDRRKRAMREWLVSCVRAGVSTALDASESDPKFMAHLEAQFLNSRYSRSSEARRTSQTAWLRLGLSIYTHAKELGLRQEEVPALARVVPRTWPISAEEARAALPEADQQALDAIDTILDELARKQWTGQGVGKRKHSDGRRHKGTISVSVARQMKKNLGAFLQFARLKDWKEFTLRELLTPERITQFFYYAPRIDGQGVARTMIANRENYFLDYFYRARMARPTPVVLITDAQEAVIRVKMREEGEHEEYWKVKPASLSNSGAYKWYPNLEQVRLAITALEDDIARADERLARHRISRIAHWRAVRDATLALCTLLCMWRVDTATTGSLLHLQLDPITNSVINEDGFAVIENIARAKNTKGDWYPFVKELTLPANVVQLLRHLFALEDRSFEEPLRDGEQAVRLSAANGDHWGKDEIMEGELTVIPMFRVSPDAPEGLSYSAIGAILGKQLARLRYAQTNPHTLRAAGAIYWTFVQGMPEELVMDLGLWEDAATLRESYARIGSNDRRRLMSSYVSTNGAVTPQKAPGRREKAAAEALTVLGTMLAKPTNPWEARRLLGDLRRHYEAIDQTIAADLGESWEAFTPNPFQRGDLERVDAALRGAGYDRGLTSVLGRDILANEALETQAERRAQSSGKPLALRQLDAALQHAPQMAQARAQRPQKAPHKPALALLRQEPRGPATESNQEVA